MLEMPEMSAYRQTADLGLSWTSLIAGNTDLGHHDDDCLLF